MDTEKESAESQDEGAPEKEEKEAPAQVSRDDDGNVVVKAPERQNRNQRRASEHAELRESVKRMEQETARITRENAELRERLSRPAMQPPPQGQQQDPFRSYVASVRAQQEDIQAMLRSGTVRTEDEAKRLRDRFYKLEDDIEDARTERAVKLASARAPQGQDPAEFALRSEFPDVVAHKNAATWAVGQYHQLRAEGWEESIETSREAMKRAREKFTTRPNARPAPTDAEKARYSSIPSQAGGKSAAPDIKLSQRDQAMAIARWPDVDESEAFRRFTALARKRDAAQGSEA